MKEKTKKLNGKTKLYLLFVCSFLASTLPLIICIFAKWNTYVQTPADTVKLSIGGILALFFIFLKAVGKLHLPSRIVVFGVIFVMSYLLKSLLQDLILLSGLALLGEAIDFFVFQRMIRITQEDLKTQKTADATSSKIEEILNKHLGRT